MNKLFRIQSLRPGFLFAAIVLASASLHGQASVCQAVAAHVLSPADKAYRDNSYAQAEQLYMQALAEQPHDGALAAKLVETLLHENKVAQAAEQMKAALATNPNAAAVLTAQAEVEVRQGQPWLAMKSLDAAAAADACYARVHLVRSQIFRIDSMYASERAELEKAYDIDKTDPDIMMAWSHVIPAAKEIAGTAEALGSMKDIDAQTRTKAVATIHSMMPLLHEGSQTCKVLPTAASATIPLLPLREDSKHVDGFQVEVKFAKTTAKLQLDTAASGLYISKTLAEENGFEQGPGAPAGTVQADTVQVGPLEFHDCMVGVSETPFPGNVDGYISTDILARYLITIDAREEKLKLDPLPPQPGVLPGDRANWGELAGYEPVYHRRQYLLVPVTLSGKTRKLFALDTGMRMSAMNSETAHTASDIKVNFTNSLPTKAGPPAHVYRDGFNFQFAGLSTNRKGGSILEFEPTVIDQNTGFDVAGLLGFDVLGPLTMHLDYRDGLVKLEAPDSMQPDPKESKAERAKKSSSESQECPVLSTDEVPLNQTIELRVLGTLDSAHLKPGKKIYGQVVHGVIYPGCTLDEKSIVYGHVTAVSSSRNPDTAELGLVFDRGECTGQSAKPLTLYLIAVLTPPSEQPEELHNAISTEVAGGRRNLSNAVNSIAGLDSPLSEGEKPKTVHPGLVSGASTMKLDPLGGPSCSAKITSTARNIKLGTGAELILTLSEPPDGGH